MTKTSNQSQRYCLKQTVKAAIADYFDWAKQHNKREIDDEQMAEIIVQAIEHDNYNRRLTMSSEDYDTGYEHGQEAMSVENENLRGMCDELAAALRSTMTVLTIQIQTKQ